jgi:glycosyltransferase involved in cell wall biosynthesis
MTELLSIVIPCKNEEDYIGNLLDDLSRQLGIEDVEIFIADANSNDNTLQVIFDKNHEFPHLKIHLIEGGTVSEGRNNGFKQISTPFVLFIDSDVRFFKNDTIYQSLLRLGESNKRLLTCKLKSYSPSFKSKIAFSLYNFFHYFLSFKYPFAIGAYFMTISDDFQKFGMFNEKSDNSEDFLFSQNFKPNEFIVFDDYIGQDDRRFKKMGYIGMGKHLLTNLFRYMKNGREEFTKKSRYWE